MKNSYGSRLRKNNKMTEKNIEERTKNVYPLSHYINNGRKLNINSRFNKIEVKKRGTHYINQNSNLLLNSYNQSSDYLKNNQTHKNYNNSNCKTEYNTTNRINNHSLFDSNKQKIINLENHSHYVRFISKNKKDKEMENEYYYRDNNKEYNYKSTNNNKYPLCTIRSFHKSHEDTEKFGEFDKLKIGGDNYKINGRMSYIIKNNTYQRKDNIDENSLSKIKRNHIKIYSDYILNNNKDKNSVNYKRCNHVKNHPSLQNNRNINYQDKNNNKEINRNNVFSQSQNKYKYEQRNALRNINYLKRNYTDHNYTTESSEKKDLSKKENIYIVNRNDKKMKSIENYSPKNELFNSPEFNKYNNGRNKEYNKNINKTNTSTSKILKEHDLILPIKLNIRDKNKEKLSRIKRIIEKSSTNQNFYQIDLHKYFKSKIMKSIEEKNNTVPEKVDKPIFKKKKIKMYTKEKNKDEGIFFENNFLVTSPITQTKKYKPNLLLNNAIKDNNQIQSLVASYNLFIQKNENENEKKNSNKINNENKLSSKETEHTSYLNKTFKKKKVCQKKKNTNNNNIEDTISLSNSKEQNLSFNSIKERNNGDVEEQSISLPFLIENFNIFYETKSKKLIINDNEKDKDNKYLKNNDIDIDSDEDYYQLTKEILLLKKGLAKKSELSKEIKRKLKDIRPQRIYQLSLIGSKGIYKKKKSNYKLKNHF